MNGPARTAAATGIAALLITTSTALMTPAAPTRIPALDAAAASAHTAAPVAGSAGVGDRYYPAAGNGGYDAAHYDVRLRYLPKGGRIRAVVTMTARADVALSRFNLDLSGLTVTRVTVNGAAAAYRRSGQELIITPRTPLAARQRFRVVVEYRGTPRPRNHPRLGRYGWIPTRDGAITPSEPDGTPTWLPVNDHPSDKATYRFRVTVPRRLDVVANGLPGPVRHRGATSTYTWHERHPMASYLAFIGIGKFDVKRGKVGTIPVITAVDPRFRRHHARLHKATIAATRWAASVFGPYPFSSVGGVIDDARTGYALETQERPVYMGFAPSENFVVHEIAHQWFGNSVSVARWRDIWLNEGFAAYAEWLSDEQRRGRPAREVFRRHLAAPADASIYAHPPGRPGATTMFSDAVYVRGAMALHALRERVGDRTFFDILRTWTRQRRDGNARISDFIALAERRSGKNLKPLFHTWLYAEGKPRA